MKVVKGEKTEHRAKQKEDCLSCGPSGAPLPLTSTPMVSSQAHTTSAGVDRVAELPSFGGDG